MKLVMKTKKPAQRVKVKLRVTKQGEAKLNASGNRRGMHNAENPPSSEQMREVRSGRKLWNKHMPVLACDNCAYTAQCPQFRAGYECAFLPFLHGHKIESEQDLINYSKEMVEQNLRRVQQGMMMETMTGGAPSLDMTEQMGSVFSQLMQLHERVSKKLEASVLLSGPSGGIVQQLFGNMGNLLEHVTTSQKEIAKLPQRADAVGEDDPTILDIPMDFDDSGSGHGKELVPVGQKPLEDLPVVSVAGR